MIYEETSASLKFDPSQGFKKNECSFVSYNLQHGGSVDREVI